MRVRLMGASVLRERLGNRESIEVLDAGVIGAPGFLQSLDAFIYRTDPIWSEPSGRVVVEERPASFRSSSAETAATAS